MIAGQRFPELLQRPLGRRMGRDVGVENPAGSDLHDEEDDGVRAGFLEPDLG